MNTFIGYPISTLIVFIVSVASLIAFDFFSHRKREVVSLKSAVCWSGFYAACAMSFAVYLYFSHGSESASLFLTGYSLEKVLAFDNLFVFSLIFSYFKIPEEKQHAALYWGIAGAIVFRLIFVVVGVSAMDSIGPMVEVIFALLILMSVVMIIKSGDDEDVNYDNTWYVKAVKKVFPGAGVFFVCVCVIEISDVLFSFDSVPAIIAITKDPLLIYSSMIFAILGLRSLYFVISGLERFFVHMDKAVVLVLLFISAKLLGSAILDFHISPNLSLAIIIGMLTIGAISSIIVGDENETQAA